MCVDACKAKGMNENSKRRYTLMKLGRRGRNNKQKYCRKKREGQGDDKFVCVCACVCACACVCVCACVRNTYITFNS